jgi:hypothetical protein
MTMARKPIPPPSSARGILMLWVPVSIITSLVISSVIAVTLSPPKLGQLIWGELPPYFLAVFGVFVVIIALRLYMARPKYYYDEKGIYRRTQLVSDWNTIATIKMSSKPGRSEPPAPPMINFFSARNPVENAEFYPLERVDTSKYFFSFVDRNGKEVARCPTNPSSFSIGGVSEDLIETAKRARPDLSIS